MNPGLYLEPSIYARPIFYQIILADALAYSTYCITVTLHGITASEKYSMPVAHKWRLADFQKPFSTTARSWWRHRRCISTLSKTWFPPACNQDSASIWSFMVVILVDGPSSLRLYHHFILLYTLHSIYNYYYLSFIMYVKFLLINRLYLFILLFIIDRLFVSSLLNIVCHTMAMANIVKVTVIFCLIASCCYGEKDK